MLKILLIVFCNTEFLCPVSYLINVFLTTLTLGETRGKSTTFDRALTNSFHMRIMSPKLGSNPRYQTGKALVLTIAMVVEVPRIASQLAKLCDCLKRS